MTGALVSLDGARRMLAEARSVLDAKNVRDKAEAIRSYARLANDRNLEIEAAEVRLRAEYRVGEMLLEIKAAGGLDGTANLRSQRSLLRGGVTLEQLGIDRNFSMRAQKLAAIPAAEFEKRLGLWRDDQARVQARAVASLFKAVTEPPPPTTAGPTVPLESMGNDFAAVLVDPPWRYEAWSKHGEGRSPQKKYVCMSREEIAAFPVCDRLLADAVVVLWLPWMHLLDAVWLIENWGLRYSTGGAWEKLGSNGQPIMGTGHRLRGVCEPFLIAVKGSPKTDGRSLWNLIKERRRGHSRKPEDMYEFIEQLVPGGPWLEMFARSTERPGWKAWGDEVGKFGQAGEDST